MESQENSDEWRKIIQKLVDTAFQKGVSKAIEEAKALNDPFLMDKFHDVLVDELKDVLIEKQHKV